MRSLEIVKTDFWEDGCVMLMFNTCFLLRRAGYKLSIDAVVDIVRSMPRSLEEVASEGWTKSSACGRCLQEANAKGRDAEERSVVGVLEGLNAAAAGDGHCLVVMAGEATAESLGKGMGT